MKIFRFRERPAAVKAPFACTACREDEALAPFEQRIDINGHVFDLWLCLSCHAVLNATHLKMISDGVEFESLQSDSSDEFYAVDRDFLDTISATIDSCHFIDFLFDQNPDQSAGTFLDFGAGRGILSGAAAKRFDRVYSAELSLNVLAKVHAAMPLKDKIVITDDYRSIPSRFDCIASMHVLEHLPNMRDILDNLVAKLNPGGTLFFQVPMLRSDYLLNVHYTFLNEVSARSLFKNLGLDTVGIWFDHNLDFLTCIGKKI